MTNHQTSQTSVPNPFQSADLLDSLDRINDEFILKLEADMQINAFNEASMNATSALHDLDMSQYISVGAAMTEEPAMSSRSSDSGLSSDNMEM